MRVALRLIQLAEAADKSASEYAEQHAVWAPAAVNLADVRRAQAMWALKREAEGRAEGYRHAYRLLAEVIPGGVDEEETAPKQGVGLNA